MIGCEQMGAGVLVSGGSMANLSALAAARTAANPDIARTGAGRGSPLRVYVSEEAHFSIEKAASLLGIGSENVQKIRTDRSLRMDVAKSDRRIDADLAPASPRCVSSQVPGL